MARQGDDPSVRKRKWVRAARNPALEIREHRATLLANERLRPLSERAPSLRGYAFAKNSGVSINHRKQPSRPLKSKATGNSRKAVDLGCPLAAGSSSGRRPASLEESHAVLLKHPHSSRSLGPEQALQGPQDVFGSLDKPYIPYREVNSGRLETTDLPATMSRASLVASARMVACSGSLPGLFATMGAYWH